MRRASLAIVEVVRPVVEGLGYRFVGAEFGQAENGQTLRVYIDTDAEAGILIDDCVAVSRQLDAVMDVEDPIRSAYQLEVSSPGVDRPLFDAGQFESVIGEEVRVRLLTGLRAGVGGEGDLAASVDGAAAAGRRNFRGRLVAVDALAAGGGTATVEVDGVEYALSLDEVEQAHLIGRLP